MVEVENLDLSKYSSMRTGGIAPRAMFPQSEKDLVDSITLLSASGERFMVLGNMSNVLVPDEGIAFVPVITTELNEVSVIEETNTDVLVYAYCGAMLTRFAMEMCKKGYEGMTFAYGIPGTVGGGVFMNAGAYGSEISNVVEYVDCFDVKNAKKERIDGSNCGFSYRHSVFSDNGYIIIGAAFRLKKGDPDSLVKIAKETMQKRVDKQPLEYPSCGSAFKRPEGYFAGALIEESGLKGFSVGGAQVSDKHAGFIINKGGATTEQVVALIKEVKRIVREKTGIELEPEIRALDEEL